MATHQDVLNELKQHIKPEKAAFFPKFMKALPGGYGEGDRFLGVIVPDQRRTAAKFKDLPEAQLKKLIESPWHEARLTGLFILVQRFEREKDSGQRQYWVDFYLDRLDFVNNWDLVDSTAHKILGAHLLTHTRQRDILFRLARSKDLWRQRVSVIATFPLLKNGEFDELLQLFERFIDHPHDLMHKAVGWMLREAGKVDLAVLRGVLATHASRMPRTMLRYSIEKLSPAERQKWLKAS